MTIYLSVIGIEVTVKVMLSDERCKVGRIQKEEQRPKDQPLWYPYVMMEVDETCLPRRRADTLQSTAHNMI